MEKQLNQIIKKQTGYLAIGYVIFYSIGFFIAARIINEPLINPMYMFAPIGGLLFIIILREKKQLLQYYFVGFLVLQTSIGLIALMFRTEFYNTKTSLQYFGLYLVVSVILLFINFLVRKSKKMV